MVAAHAGLATGKWAKILQAGNPTPRADASIGQRLPSVTSSTSSRSRVIPTIQSAATHQSAMGGRVDRIRRRDNPWVLVDVFGKFPPSSLDALLGPDGVQAAMRRSLEEHQYDFAAHVLGVDAARSVTTKPIEMRAPDAGVDLAHCFSVGSAGRPMVFHR